MGRVMDLKLGHPIRTTHPTITIQHGEGELHHLPRRQHPPGELFDLPADIPRVIPMPDQPGDLTDHLGPPPR